MINFVSHYTYIKEIRYVEKIEFFFQSKKFQENNFFPFTKIYYTILFTIGLI